MKNVVAYLKSQKFLKAAENDLAALTYHGFDKIQNSPLRNAVAEFMDNETPMDFYWFEAGPAIVKDRPNHHTNPFGLLRSVIERIVMLPAMASHIEGMCRYDGTVDTLALDVALAATLISDTQYRGLFGILKKGSHTTCAAYAWRKFHPKTNPSITERVIAERIADAILWHHGGGDITSPPTRIRPEMRLVALVNAFCTDKAIDTIYRARITVLT